MAWTSVVIYGCVIFQLCFAFGWIVVALLESRHDRETMRRSRENVEDLKRMIGRVDLD